MNENEKLKMREKIGYALGDAGGVMTFNLISAFLQMFYTDSLHIQPAKIAVLMLVARIWDAINDPMWGTFVDTRKPTKYGRFRPYIMGFSVPLAVAAGLMFTKIPGLTETQYLIFAYVTYILYGMLYTCVNIPYGSLASVITENPDERSVLSTFRSIGAGFGGLPSTVLLPLFVYSTTETGDKVLDATKLSICVWGLAAVSVLIYFINFKLTKERVMPSANENKEKFNFGKTFKALFTNKAFIMVCLASMLLIAYQQYTQTNYNYLLKNFYNKPGLYSLVTIFTYLPMALFLPVLGKLVRKYGKKELCTIGIAFSAVINILMYLLRFTPLVNNVGVFMVLVFLSGAGLTFLVLQVWALVMDVIDYHELRTHRREEGSSYSMFSFTRKLGQTLAGFGSSAVLAMIGYDVNVTEVGAQSEEVVSKLYDVTTLIPAIALIIMAVVLKFYPLSKKKLEEMHAQLAEMRNGAEVEATAEAAEDSAE